MVARLYHYITESVDPFHNLALEEALLLNVKPDECILYLWQNSRTVVVGRNQNAEAECRISQLESEGGKLARRSSGGGAVYHDLGNLNFTFLCQAESYNVLKQVGVILHALRTFGINAELSGRNDILADGKKCSGSAYYRNGNRCYHHGTLLIDVDTDDMSKYLCVDPAKLSSKGVASVRSRVVNLRKLCPELTANMLRQQLVESCSKVYNLRSEVCSFDEESISKRREFFASPGWRYGKSFAMSSEVKERFPWGDLRLCFQVEGGRISDAQLFSDGMEADFLTLLPAILRSCRYESETLKTQLMAVPTCSEAEKQILSDSCLLIEKLFDKQRQEEDSHV